MKQLLWICAGILLTFTAVLGAFHLFYDYEYRKIRPLCGAWHSTLDDTRLVIEPCGDKFRITITRRGTSETHALHYKDCVYYTAYGGRRIDLFTRPRPMHCSSCRATLSNEPQNSKTMNSNQSTPASAVAALQQEIRTRTEVIRTLADLREQLDADRICGAWLSAENNLSASIRRIGEGMWRILVFDHALCYKRLVQDGIIALRRHRLWLGADDGNRVIYDASTETLTIGCYGRFVPEDCIRRQEDDAISAEACDFNEPAE
ncbi:MAG: hypothetical protein ACLRXZ_04970 [Alistipes finegoldii]